MNERLFVSMNMYVCACVYACVCVRACVRACLRECQFACKTTFFQFTQAKSEDFLV